jgi:hypothetical protein
VFTTSAIPSPCFIPWNFAYVEEQFIWIPSRIPHRRTYSQSLEIPRHWRACCSTASTPTALLRRWSSIMTAQRSARGGVGVSPEPLPCLSSDSQLLPGYDTHSFEPDTVYMILSIPDPVHTCCCQYLILYIHDPVNVQVYDSVHTPILATIP